MIDFPIGHLFDDSLCLMWLERHLHPDGFVCPTCGSANRRRVRQQGDYDAYRCRECTGYDTLLKGAGTGLRSFLRPFGGGHKAYLRQAIRDHQAATGEQLSFLRGKCDF